jgi:Protein of unknown function (DUF3592)
MAPHPTQWTDPRTWPWFFDLWAAFALLGFAKPIWRWFRRHRAESWPPTQGRVESTEINQSKRFRTSSTSPSVAAFKYSYEVCGAKYAGTYKKQFGTDEESEDFLRDITSREVTVQYNPERPSRSFILDNSIKYLLSNRLPSAASPLEIRRYWNPLPIWLMRVLPVFEALAIIGFVLSVLVNVGALTSRWTPPSAFWALHVGIFVVFFPAIFVGQKRVGSTHRKDFWKLVLKGAPDWMKYLLYAVFAYAAAIDVTSWIRGAQQPSGPSQSSGFGDWTEFSVVWIVFYWASFAILYSAMREERLLPRCVKGHPVPPGANFCRECGQPVVRT